MLIIQSVTFQGKSKVFTITMLPLFNSKTAAMIAIGSFLDHQLILILSGGLNQLLLGSVNANF